MLDGIAARVDDLAIEVDSLSTRLELLAKHPDEQRKLGLLLCRAALVVDESLRKLADLSDMMDAVEGRGRRDCARDKVGLT
jgi:hypothetical protein